MKVLNLRCAQHHAFEGWFSGDDEFQSQLDGGRLTCPLCGDAAITRLPTAPRVLRSGRREGHAAGAPASASEVSEMSEMSEMSAALSDAGAPRGGTRAERAQAEWLQRARRVLAATEDVGDRFAAEARRIHDGQAPERAIRGQATPQEAMALAEDGIQVVAVPAALKETLQ